MEFTIEEELKILSNIEKMKKAIDLEVDWYISYLQEQDPRKKQFYLSMFLSKQDARVKLAKEISNENFYE